MTVNDVSKIIKKLIEKNIVIKKNKLFYLNDGIFPCISKFGELFDEFEGESYIFSKYIVDMFGCKINEKSMIYYFKSMRKQRKDAGL